MTNTQEPTTSQKSEGISAIFVILPLAVLAATVLLAIAGVYSTFINPTF